MKFDSDIVIGLEVHVQLDTKTKLFCGCPTKGSDEPNSRTCPTCLGMPGSRPVFNKKALEYGLKFAIATGSAISKQLVFSRKSYFYPDLAKNYQITQYELPLAKDGFITVNGRKIMLTRAHLEEDPAALVHPKGVGKSVYVLVDYNRSGNPLLEIVTEPMLRSPEEAREFLRELMKILSYLEIFDLKDGIIKADANVSIQRTGYARIEIKNITGFKEIEAALKYEVDRQRTEKVVTETRLWDSERRVTERLREKEAEIDYGYIVDSDLPMVEITDQMVEKISKEMPELAAAKMERFVKEHGLAKEDALVLTAEKTLAELYEKVAKHVERKLAAKWLRRELMRVVHYNKKELHEVIVDEGNLIALLGLVQEGKITEQVGQKLIEMLIERPFDVKAYVKKEGLAAVSDTKKLEKYCKEAIKENSKAVEDYKKGNEKALHFIVGAVMKKTKGKATPKEVNEILKKMVGR